MVMWEIATSITMSNLNQPVAERKDESLYVSSSPFKNLARKRING